MSAAMQSRDDVIDAVREAEAVEQWRPVAGWERYSVSDAGRVRGPKKILSPMKNWNGYFRVCLRSGEKTKSATVHSLVLRAFVGGRPHGFHGCHISGVKSDNRLCNLKWASASENYDDKRRHGTDQSGEAHGSSKLTAEQVLLIRQRYASRTTTMWGSVALAKEFGVTRDAIDAAAHGRTWKCLPLAQKSAPGGRCSDLLVDVEGWLACRLSEAEWGPVGRAIKTLRIVVDRLEEAEGAPRRENADTDRHGWNVMTLPFDDCRCTGVSTDEGELVAPCNTCRRVLEAQPSGPRTPWFAEPPISGSECVHLLGSKT